jgi:hydrogenase maturation protein HypF
MGTERLAITVQGIVQGVGMRPRVYGLAARMGLGGFVRNDPGGVQIEVEGSPGAVRQFLGTLRASPPPLARLEQVRATAMPPLGEAAFRIEPSGSGAAAEVRFAPDRATCEACLSELGDPGDRRYRHPFINCTDCGPRLTIVQGPPYDRATTTMARFAMCDACRREYEDPGDRRFHAQPIACPRCGPTLRLLGPDGARRPAADPIRAMGALLSAGRVGAIKGLGGFHLACDARSEAAVQRLREGKLRGGKPFAVMAAHLEQAEGLAHLDEGARMALDSPARPIVLAPRREGAGLAPGVAPETHLVGVMLPYTPVHHLLMDAVGGRPLVMTSANRSDAPIVFRDGEVCERLGGIAEAVLTHDREIALPCEDSVVRALPPGVIPIRRSRGQAPVPIELPRAPSTPTIALGGHLKSVFALAAGPRAILGPHLGDLEDWDAYRGWVQALERFEQLYRLVPGRLVHDAHPGYASTNYAVDRAAREAGLQLVSVQHHHAHMASCMAEHGLDGELIGVCFDGSGHGPDGTVWGGEWLLGGYRTFRRFAHLKRVPMPGGDRAAREPWRMAFSHLWACGETEPGAAGSVDSRTARNLARMMERGLNSPMTSSMGRLFDAVASLCGLCDHNGYEARSGMLLEQAAATVHKDGAYSFALQAPPRGSDAPWLADPAPVLQQLLRDRARGADAPRMARRFHEAVAELVMQVCVHAREQTGLSRVALSGGVFCNGILVERATTHLQSAGFDVYRHQLVPPNDGGLCLGQLAVAAAQEED